MNIASPSFHMNQENNHQLNEISQCLKYTAYIIDNNMILTSPLHQTLSNQTVTLDQVLPARLENYMMATIEQDQNFPQYISNLSLQEILNQIRHDQILQFAKPLVIQQQEQKQFQIINTQSNKQIGFQQKKTDGLLSNQIFNSKINNTRSISPQPMSTIIHKTQSNTQSQIPILQTESGFINDQFMNLNPNLSSSNSLLNDTPQSYQQHQLNKWTDKSKEKILFQDNFMVEEETTKQPKPNTIIIKKSEDPQFFQQLKNARVASPNLKQVKGSGLSPEPYNQNKSKSPDVLQVNLPTNCKKWETNSNIKQLSQQSQQQPQNKLPDHFKKLLTDSSKRQNISKPFDSNNTKFALIQSNSNAHLKKTKQTKQQIIQDSLNDNQIKVVQSEKQFTPRMNEQEYTTNQDIQMMLSEQQSIPKSRSQNKKQDEKFNEYIYHQNQNFKDHFSFKPQFEQKQFKQIEVKQEITPQIIQQQLVESKSIRGISPQNRSIQQQFKQQNNIIQQPPIPPNQQKEPIQIKLDIKQFMNSNKLKDQQERTPRSISPIYSQRQQLGVTNENGRSYFVNLNFQK
ncbi:unnamed protein product [Paramecium sonneborni]|uniref:Uncharacterized protein n=1 Tax=Paramecium sonneborni TaxID=65129 RepID=A0A8S1RHA7_9CILI|nr:unnamed protein product [Paramecium sonneborni]